MKNARERKRSETEERLLEASIALLREKGYAQFRPGEVGAKAGLSEGLVFRYFETKTDLVAAALTKELNRIIASVESVPAVFPDAPPTRKDLLSAAAGLILSHDYRWLFEIWPAVGFDDQLRERLGSTINDYIFRLERAAAQVAIDAGGLPPNDAIAFMRLVIYSLQGAALTDIATSPSGREQSVIAMLLSVATVVLGPEAPR